MHKTVLQTGPPQEAAERTFGLHKGHMQQTIQLYQTESENDIGVFCQLAYCSVLTQQLGDAEVQAIVDHARQSNVANNITGPLMIEHRLVIQWLEGKKSDVRKLWANLKDGPRHHCLVELLHRDFADTCLLPNWSMQRTTREEMLEIVHGARKQAESSEPSPWAATIGTMCLLIDPEYAKTHGAALLNRGGAVVASSANGALTVST